MKRNYLARFSSVVWDKYREMYENNELINNNTDEREHIPTS